MTTESDSPRTSVTIKERVDLPPEDVWELLIDTEAQVHWLGRGGEIPLEGVVVLPVSQAPWRFGSVVERNDSERRIDLIVGPAPNWSTQMPTVVRIDVLPDGTGNEARSVVQVNESAPDAPEEPSPFSAGLLRDIESYWKARMGRLSDLADSVRKRRQPAQAVVVVHGIGEQVPGQTLERFVQAVVPDSESKEVRSKPDRISESLELRRLSLPRRGDRPKTDFFELYWAHHIRDTTPRQLLSWAWRLLLRRDVPSALRPVLLGAWAVLVLTGIGLALLVLSILQSEGALGLASAISLAGSAILSLVSFAFVRNVGDAARYLRASPENISAREQIRKQGLELLRRLHAAGRYNRIVIVGHSLGSVIGYDILTQLWTEIHREHLRPRVTSFTDNAWLHRCESDDLTKVQAGQHRVWSEMRRNTQPWLISDFITLGSPLTYADFLMTTGRAPDGRPIGRQHEWNELIRQRIVASAPPVRDEKPADGLGAFWFQENYVNRDGLDRKTFRVMHHAAPFAAVRWTNLSFPTRLALLGDPIGGPVSQLFGSWVYDIALDAPTDWDGLGRLWLHSAYWTTSEADQDTETHTPLSRLRAALQLGSHQALQSEALNHPPTMYLREP